MKKLLVSIFAAVCGLAANAEVTLSISDFTISAGESKTITVNLNRPDGEEVGSFACCILLPEGITIDQNKNGKYKFSIPAECYDPDEGNAPTASSALQADGSVKVIAFSTDAIPFICPDGGAVLNVPITASSDLKSGEGEVKVYNQDITNCTGTKTYTTKTTQTTAKVTMTGSTGVGTINAASEDATIYNVNGQVMNKAGRGVNIVKTKSGAKKVLNK